MLEGVFRAGFPGTVIFHLDINGVIKDASENAKSKFRIDKFRGKKFWERVKSSDSAIVKSKLRDIVSTKCDTAISYSVPNALFGGFDSVIG